MGMGVRCGGEGMRLSFHCTCGTSMTGNADPVSYKELKKAWDQIHSGEGHSPCDAKTARRIRRKLEREAEKEMEK